VDRLAWCAEQARGLRLTEPDDNLGDAHIRKAEEALGAMRELTSKDWQATAAYYTMYHAVYALLARIGIKSGIHTCTLEAAKRHLTNHLTKAQLAIIDKAFDTRQKAQYHVRDTIPKPDHDHVTAAAPLVLDEEKTRQQVQETNYKDVIKESKRVGEKLRMMEEEKKVMEEKQQTQLKNILDLPEQQFISNNDEVTPETIEKNRAMLGKIIELKKQVR